MFGISFFLLVSTYISGFLSVCDVLYKKTRLLLFAFWFLFWISTWVLSWLVLPSFFSSFRFFIVIIPESLSRL